jgi:hypothetical protein
MQQRGLAHRNAQYLKKTAGLLQANLEPTGARQQELKQTLMFGEFG